MAETDPYSTSYAERVPRLNEAVERVAAKRLRKQSEGRGNRTRQEIEGKAPRWGNEASALKGSQASPPGHSVSFQSGANPGPFKLGFPGVTTKPRRGHG
jgi:hypothetical protein